MIDRRNFLRFVGVSSLSAVAVGHASSASGAPRSPLGLPVKNPSHSLRMGDGRPADAGVHPPLEKFSLPLPILEDAKPLSWKKGRGKIAYKRQYRGSDVYYSEIRQLHEEIYPGHSTSVYGYFGSWQPKVIRARKNRRTIVIQRNMTKVPVSVHLHGGATRAQFDGEMSRPVAPGSLFAYLYDNDQTESVLFMHDHTHHTDAENVYRGMSSPFIITSDEEEALGLPSGEFEVPLVLRDGDFASDGRMIHVMDDTTNRSTILVNGTPWPRMDVKRRKYRFRVINSSAMRFFVLVLSDGTPMTQIGSDCSLLEAPVQAPIVVLSPGERADVVIDFSRWSTGSDVDVQNYIGPGPMEDVGQVMRFRVGEDSADDSQVPPSLFTMPAMPEATIKRTFSLESSEPGVMPMVGMINGQAFAMNRIDTTVKWGTTEEWSVTNTNATIPHNFHCHLAHMRVIDRDGAPPSPEERGFKDTVAIFPGQTIRVQMTFDTHRGVYPYHCHMLDHGAMGMMAQLRVV